MKVQGDTIKVLEILVDNLATGSPQVVHTEYVASHMRISKKVAKNLVMSLHASGDVVTDIEGRFALITAKGYGTFQQAVQGARQIM